MQPFTVSVTVRVYVPGSVTVGSSTELENAFGPLQLKVTPEVELEPSSWPDVVVQFRVRSAPALACGVVVFMNTSAASVLVQLVCGSVTVRM
ncbi:MAG: hypothetical protein GFGODING_02502 [Flavobacteriales bacterium]|nr:hypothetical protein [Flavobacteriales bacterium]